MNTMLTLAFITVIGAILSHYQARKCRKVVLDKILSGNGQHCPTEAACEATYNAAAFGALSVVGLAFDIVTVVALFLYFFPG